MRRAWSFVWLVFAASSGFAQARIASDFEIATAQKQLATSRDPRSLIAAHLNLGDLYASRREGARAGDEYHEASAIARKERLASRERSDLNGYAMATAYAGLAGAKLGLRAEAFDAFEEAIRYESDSPAAWNLYSSAMRINGANDKAIAAARNAVDIAVSGLREDSPVADVLNLGVYRYSLASALLDDDRCASCANDATALLQLVIATLESPRFDAIRRDVARQEQFEIFSSTQSDPASYLSLLNRSRMQLARIFESGGRTEEARAEYQRVVQSRSDDATALAALARLARSDAERQQMFAASFDANPLSLALIQDYEKYARLNPAAATSGDAPGATVRRAIEEFAHGRFRESDAALDRLDASLRDNDVIRYLRARNAAALGNRGSAASIADSMSSSPDLQRDVRQLLSAGASRSRPTFLDAQEPLVRDPSQSDLAALIVLLRENSLSPDDRARLDSLTFSSRVTLDAISSAGGTTTIASGRIGSTAFQFATPTAFRGDFSHVAAIRLDYRIAGLTESASGEALLVEPIRLEASE